MSVGALPLAFVGIGTVAGSYLGGPVANSRLGFGRRHRRSATFLYQSPGLGGRSHRHGGYFTSECIVAGADHI